MKINESFENYIAQYQQQLLRYINSKVGNVDDAEDILAVVFEKLIKQSNKPEKPIAWLYQVTKNSIIDYYRVQRKTQEIPEEYAADEPEFDQFKQLAQCVLPMLNEMDEQSKQVIHLVDIEGYKQLHVATEIGISLAALKSRLLRARKQLKNQLVQCCPPIKNAKGSIIEFKSPANKCDQC